VLFRSTSVLLGRALKIIFSRKGVDSAAGKCASPIIDGRPFSIPIPSKKPTTRYGDLEPPLWAAAFDLSQGYLSPESFCHLDPDIDRNALTGGRPAGWRGALGQVSTALSHLVRQCVGQGDIFLFWGLFRESRNDTGNWRYVGPRQHAIFGWLEVDQVVNLGPDGSHVLSSHPWLLRHPHARAGYGKRNAMFIAKETLSIGDGTIPGFGVFQRPIALTKAGAASPSIWSVPRWLDRNTNGVGMTYHPPTRWLGNGTVNAAPRGQEFIADAGDRIDARDWLLSLFGGGR
jgi:hypothetical protein